MTSQVVNRAGRATVYAAISSQIMLYVFSGGREGRIRTLGSRAFSELVAFWRSISWIIFLPRIYRQERPSAEEHPKPSGKKILSVHDISEIPPSLYHDPVFSQLICPISQVPIRHIIFDPNGKTYYDRTYIIRWIQESPRSPITGKPLRFKDLIPAPALQNLIDYRLSEYLLKKPHVFQT